MPFTRTQQHPFYGSVRDEWGHERAMSDRYREEVDHLRNEVDTLRVREYENQKKIHDMRETELTPNSVWGPATIKALQQSNLRKISYELHEAPPVSKWPEYPDLPPVFGKWDIVQWVGWGGTVATAVYFLYQWAIGA